MTTQKTPPAEPELNRDEIAAMNVWTKLLTARQEFYAVGTKKTGINLHAEFKYFELADIVPVAEPIFAKYGLLLVPTFVDGNAIADVVNTEKPNEHIYFSIPLQFITEPGKFRMNEVQGVGAAVTYYRRYLYMIVLDLVENDSIDDGSGEDDAPAPAPKKKPVTKEKRKEIKETLTGADNPADELQINALRAALKKLREMDPSRDDLIQEIALKTNSFTSIKKSTCEKLILMVNEMIENCNTEE